MEFGPFEKSLAQKAENAVHRGLPDRAVALHGWADRGDDEHIE
jgi:hypothetical protein